MNKLQHPQLTPPEITLRSEEVQDILGRPPQWIIRWGISVILSVVLMLFMGSYFFKYPDVVQASVTVNSEHLPAQIVSKISGRIDSLFVHDEQRVNVGEPLALMQSSTVFADYLTVKEEWHEVATVGARHASPLHPVPGYLEPRTNLQLGDLQPAYGALLKAYSDYSQFIAQDYHNKKIAALRLQMQKQKRISAQQLRQLQSAEKQIEIASATFRTDSTLYAKGVISASEYNQAEQTFLNALQSIENARTSNESQTISILQSEQQIYDLEREREVQNNLYELNFSTAKEQFFSQLSSWEQSYLLQSPIAGRVSFTTYFQQHQNIGAGEVLLTVVPDSAQRLIGKILLPQRGAGKVKEGQAVNLKFEHFPYLEYGMVRAKIRSISKVPIVAKEQSVFVVEVDFPEGLQTNYGKTLTFSQNMEGTAEIITEDLRLIDKFLNPIKSVLKR